MVTVQAMTAEKRQQQRCVVADATDQQAEFFFCFRFRFRFRFCFC